MEPSPEKSSSKKVAAKLFILQESAEPLFSVPVWAEPSQLLFGMWVCSESQLPEIPPIGLGMKPNTSPGQEALAEMGDSAQANGHDHLKIESRTTV
jgi:hypothetical protein